MHLYPIDGAVHDVAPADTPFSYRDCNWAEVIVGVDPDPANAGALRDWTVDYWEATHEYSAGGAYVNFMMDEGDARVRATYGTTTRGCRPPRRRTTRRTCSGSTRTSRRPADPTLGAAPGRRRGDHGQQAVTPPSTTSVVEVT